MRRILEVLRLHHEGNLSHRMIARAVSASPTTVGEILRRANWPALPGRYRQRPEWFGRLAVSLRKTHALCSVREAVHRLRRPDRADRRCDGR